MSKSIYSSIEDVNYEWIKDADNYANEIGGGKWGWYSDVSEISYSLPFHRTMLGFNHTYFVIDLDPKIIKHPEMDTIIDDPVLYREICIRALIDFTSDFVEKIKPNEFFARLSGSGIHLVQRIPERIDKRRLKTVIRHICKPCSNYFDEDHVCSGECDGWNFTKRWSNLQNMWKNNPFEWSRVYYHEPTQALLRITVDLQMYTSKRKMIRWTYSRNQKIPQMFNYAIPIDFWDADFILQHMTREGFDSYPPHKYTIPDFSFHDYLMPENQLSDPVLDETTSPYPVERDLSYTINVPDVGAELTQAQITKIDRMKELISGSVEMTPPCIRQHYDNSMLLDGQFWPRVALVRYLSGKGFGPDDVALFFRFHINDERDNTPNNKDKLFTGVKESYGPLESPDMVPGCDKMRNHDFFGVVDQSICDVCGRTYPLASYPEDKEFEREKEDLGWDTIQMLCRNVLLGGESSVLTKATRAGVTTSLIAMTKLVGKNMLVVTPTNRIGEKTIPNALKIAKEKLGVDIRGAMFAANKRSCLKLVLLGKEIRHRKNEEPNWGDQDIAFDRLHYNNRPECEDCVFRQSYFQTLRHAYNNPDQFPIPILHAEVDNWEPDILEEQVDGRCAYITIKEFLSEIDVMFTTYSKLTALMQNETEDAQIMREAMAEHFDVIMLDEVSYLTNQSPLIVPVLRKRRSTGPTNDTRDFSVNIFHALEDEMDLLNTIIETGTTNQAIGMLQNFIDSQRHLMYESEHPYSTERIHNRDDLIVSEDDREYLGEHFTAFHGLIERAAREQNMHLEKTEDVLHLLNSEHWIRLSIPTIFHPVDISIISEPDVSYLRRFLRFFNTDGRQILVTDATLPYVRVADFLNMNLNEFNIGDPRGTNDHQMVIADSRRMSVVDLFFGKDAERFQEEMLYFINQVCDAHGPENVFLIVPNIWTNREMRKFMAQGKIPPCDMTWYRSDMTIGVECDKRVMICITAPHPPRGSHDWLAMWYHEQGLLRHEDVPVLGKNLSLNSTKAAFYQTIGRAKDPECKERSVVYLWGISGKRTFGEIEAPGAGDLMTFDGSIPMPHVSLTMWGRTPEMTVRTGLAWKNHRVMLSLDQTRLFTKVVEEGRLDTRMSHSMFREFTRKETENLIIDTLIGNPDLFKAFGISWKRGIDINKEYYILERLERNEILGTYRIQ